MVGFSDRNIWQCPLDDIQEVIWLGYQLPVPPDNAPCLEVPHHPPWLDVVGHVLKTLHRKHICKVLVALFTLQIREFDIYISNKYWGKYIQALDKHCCDLLVLSCSALRNETEILPCCQMEYKEVWGKITASSWFSNGGSCKRRALYLPGVCLAHMTLSCCSPTNDAFRHHPQTSP